MDISLLWPLALLIILNTFYHIASKAVAPEANVFVSLIISYAIACAICLFLFAVTSGGIGLIVEEIKNVNIAALTLAVGAFGIESGNIYMYKLGWDISIGNLIASIFLSILLIVVGVLFYGDQFTLEIAAGVALCMIGLVLINSN